MNRISNIIVDTLALVAKDSRKCSIQRISISENSDVYNIFLPGKEYEYFLSVSVYCDHDRTYVRIFNKHTCVYESHCSVNDNFEIFLMGCIQKAFNKR